MMLLSPYPHTHLLLGPNETKQIQAAAAVHADAEADSKNTRREDADKLRQEAQKYRAAIDDGIHRDRFQLQLLDILTNLWKRDIGFERAEHGTPEAVTRENGASKD